MIISTIIVVAKLITKLVIGSEDDMNLIMIPLVG